MKHKRADITCKAHRIPQLRFESQSLTSFSGLVLFQQFFARIDLKNRLGSCFRHLAGGKVFGRATIFLHLIVHLLLGYRELRDSRYYHNDPLVKRVLGLKRLPDVATISRMLKDADDRSVRNLRKVLRQMVIERLRTLGLSRITLDFDGSVQSTSRRAQGTAVGSTRRKVRAATTPCFAPCRRPARCSIFCIEAATYTIRAGPESS